MTLPPVSVRCPPVMPEYHYIAYSAAGRISYELIEGSPFDWMLAAIATGYEDAPYVVIHSFPVTEAQYLAHRTKFV